MAKLLDPLKVKCVYSRRIADTDYQLHQTYTMTKEQFEKYADCFTAIEEVQPKQSAKKTETKRVAKTEDKSG